VFGHVCLFVCLCLNVYLSVSVEPSDSVSFGGVSACTYVFLYVSVCVDPSDSQCFGGVFSQFLLAELLGYDDVILYSLKQLADDRPDKGLSVCFCLSPCMCLSVSGNLLVYVCPIVSSSFSVFVCLPVFVF